MNERLRAAREYLHLSREFVARHMNLSETVIYAIESGQRAVTATEIVKFSKLYGISVEELLYGKKEPSDKIAKEFSDVSDADRKEIVNLLNFKRSYKEAKG